MAGASHGEPVVGALSAPELEAAVFGGVSLSAGFPASPFLTFAVAVHRTAAALEQATFVDERVAPRVRIPVFDVTALRSVLADPLRRYFFVELLASYTRVASVVTWTRTARGWRRNRFSELDPARLASLVEVVESSERPGVYRRLGDLALFLLGVFPDHPPISGHGAAVDRLLRHSEVDRAEVADLGEQALLEHLGTSWYRAALRSASAMGQPLTGTLTVTEYVSDHFREARRVLNAVTDQYLFPFRSVWFPA